MTDSSTTQTSTNEWRTKPVAPPENVRPVVHNGELYRENAIIATMIGPMGDEHVPETMYETTYVMQCGLEFDLSDAAVRGTGHGCSNCKTASEAKWGYQPYGVGFGAFVDQSELEVVWTSDDVPTSHWSIQNTAKTDDQ